MEVKRRTVRSLVGKLSSVSEQTQLDALRQLRLMTKQDEEARPVIVDSGAIPYLADTLLSSSHDFQENASATLLNISISCRESLMSTRGVLDAISHLLTRHNSTSSAPAVQSCAATLYSLLVVDNYRPIIGSKRDIVYALVDIIKTPNSPIRSIKDALKALFGIALHPLNRCTMIQLGAVEALFSLVQKDRKVGIVEDATAVIAQIAGCEESEEAFQKVSGIGVLVDLLDMANKSSMKTKENAVSGLLKLVRCGGEKVAMDVRMRALGAFDGIADVQLNGSTKGKSKAAALSVELIGDGNHWNTQRDSRFDSSTSQDSSFSFNFSTDSSEFVLI
ncbi:U-box domain-containing protein 1-like isoform X1 [Prosopis cineraria]|uniref:U-box domain-containing protein 1-like isoform X1 n=1 Tax=Prosopis cineraria TaxID=364024 RepID=UPI00240FAE29|nr:U-box domain-containing protein 1-like isoform X1 [Prosopis cineraria]